MQLALDVHKLMSGDSSILELIYKTKIGETH
jgi:hypothetical protein